VDPSDLSDAEWAILAPLIPPAKRGGRPHRVTMRQLLNALFYLQRPRCQGRYLPQEYPPWPTVWTSFRQWRKNGTWEPYLPSCGKLRVAKSRAFGG
jgi:putative transposase